MVGAVEKANANVAFICKCFYIELSVKKLGIAPVGVSNNSSDTYNLLEVNYRLIINQHFK